MARYTLKNEMLVAEFDQLGAELRSLKQGKTEYMWSGDAAYWGRVSPVLFPFVGKTNGLVYRTNGQEYPMSQHGFARDMEFSICRQTDSEIWFELHDTEQTRNKYPFAFELQIGYRLEHNRLTVLWRVHNPSDKPLPFSIGGHPGFLYPAEQEQNECYLKFDTPQSELIITPINTQGLATHQQQSVALKDGYLPITKQLFDHDALVVENHQCHSVSLCNPDKTPYLTVTFDAPLFGIWSPPKRNAPFVCIEPWYGRCDAEDFCGALQERVWENILPAGETFSARYQICVGE